MLKLPKNFDCPQIRTVSFKEEDVQMVLRTVSFKREEESDIILTPKGSGQIVLERSLSFKNWEIDNKKLETTVSFKIQSPNAAIKNGASPPVSGSPKILLQSISPKPKCELDAAAVKLQKVYKSYRTRRNLADCAVVIEELWWKALDFASLEHNSVLFFDTKKHETAVSRWVRARKRVAKVGKGLSKDEKARKLALQHWLEAIDPRHRYGHNLHIYYDVWFDSESTQPFFYWLDIGDGKEINLAKCPKIKLQQQCIKYLGPNEREEYEVIVENGKLVYKQSASLVNTIEGSKWIFVLSTSRNLYVGQKKKGKFQHSSFLAGGATSSAGRLVAKDGVLQAIWPYSGHYLPTEENFKEFISFLVENNVDLTSVKRCSVDDDEFPSFRKQNEEPVVENTKPATFEFSKRPSCKWTTGTGPRIGCVRDYPADLQVKALEQVNLSPRVALSPVNKVPIPSPRPSPKVRLSPRLAVMGIPSPRVSLTLPSFLQK